ncbi:hypothetical protein AAHB33_08075 [Paenarthrobacter sp. S56]|uniref:hypothetical protein n=1 Tax=Paenarthrobacter sp. S56 TaxID=3138179 RepID=UPI00321BBA14
MKLPGSPTTRGLALLAVSVAVVVSACTSSPGAPESASPASSGTPSGTAPATPSAAASSTGAASGTGAASPSAVPNATATVGALVEGFPQQLIPVMPKSSVRSSSFDKNASPATVALVGTVKAPPEGVVEFYKTSLEGQGFKVVPGPEAVGNVTSIDFIRGEGETINLSVRQKEGVSTFTIGANVAAGSVK